MIVDMFIWLLNSRLVDRIKYTSTRLHNGMNDKNVKKLLDDEDDADRGNVMDFLRENNLF